MLVLGVYNQSGILGGGGGAGRGIRFGLCCRGASSDCWSHLSCQVDWSKVHVFLVDERCVPADDPANNLTQLKVRQKLRSHARLLRTTSWRASAHSRPVAALSAGRLSAESSTRALERHLSLTACRSRRRSSSLGCIPRLCSSSCEPGAAALRTGDLSTNTRAPTAADVR